MQNIVNENVVEFMRSRRSVPAKFMNGPGPDKDQIKVILEIACRVPDHGKLKPWRFIQYGAEKCIMLGEKILARALLKNSNLGEEFVDIERQRFTRAPVVIAVVSCARPHVKIPEWEQLMSSGAVAMNMLIAANAHGFDVQWLTEWYSYDKALREDFGLNEGEQITGFIHIGTRMNPKNERDRPNLDEIYTLMDG